MLARDVNDNAPCLDEHVVWTFIVGTPPGACSLLQGREYIRESRLSSRPEAFPSSHGISHCECPVRECFSKIWSIKERAASVPRSLTSRSIPMMASSSGLPGL